MTTQANDVAELGPLLRRVLAERNLTYDEVQDRTGVAKSTISDIVNNKVSPSLDTLNRLAVGPKLSLGQLIERAGFDLGLHQDAHAAAARRLTDADLEFIDTMNEEELEEFLAWIDVLRRRRQRKHPS